MFIINQLHQLISVKIMKLNSFGMKFAANGYT